MLSFCYIYGALVCQISVIKYFDVFKIIKYITHVFFFSLHSVLPGFNQLCFLLVNQHYNDYKIYYFIEYLL